MPRPLDTCIEEAPLRLRPWRPDDAPALHEAVRESVASVGRWLPWCDAGYDLASAEAWIAQCRADWLTQEQFAFGVFDLGDGSLLGSVGLNQRNLRQRSAAAGYWVRQSRQQRGVATHALRLAAAFGFRQLGLVRLEIVVLPDNHASRRVAERSGARFEAIARQRLWMAGAAHDAAVYALVPPDLDRA